jgi:phosphatidylglycerol:prolipoprotein diacylglycerol transferase
VRPILFTIFGFPVRAYGVFIAIAFLAGLWLARQVAAKRRPGYVPLIEDFALVALISAIVGARAWEVIFTWDFYKNNLWEIPAIWHGGLSIQGAIAGGTLAAIWFTRSRKLSFWDFADTLTPAVLLGQAIGRLGACLLNGDAFGKPTGTRFGIIYAPGTPAYETFGPVPLWPAEVFEGLWDLAVMGLALWLLKRERPAGTVFLWYVVLYSLGRFSLEFLRADSLMFMGLKAAQVTSVILAAAALLLLARRRNAPANTPTA